MKYNCIVVDDDPVFQLIIKELINNDHRLQTVGVAGSGEDAKKLYSEHAVDILFLDLGLPGMNGFEFIESIGNPEDLQIILVTGQKDYALDAFEYDVVDYLVKPISKERFKKAVTRAIHKKADRASAPDHEDDEFRRLARFMYSRDIATLEPMPMRSAKMGYRYPFLTDQFDFEREQKSLDILKEAESKGYLTSDFVDCAYICNSCYNSHLHFRESCPNCESTWLEAEDQIHHFACAYVGPVSDFYEKATGEDHNMTCPKCDKTLNHIGVDYDKPSLVYRCKKCDHRFQNPEIKAKCHNCGADTRVEYLLKKTFSKYHLTRAGKELATSRKAVAVSNESENNKDEEGLFHRSIENAITRKKDSDDESCIGEINFTNLSLLFQEIGEERAKELQDELHGIIQQEISSDDAVYFPEDSRAYLLLAHKNMERSKTSLQELAATLHELIQDNFNNFDATISMRVQRVEKEKPADEQMRIFKEVSFSR